MTYRIRRKLKSINKGRRPILMVNKTNKHFYVQLVGVDGKVIVAASDHKVNAKKDLISKMAKKIAKEAKEAKIKEIVFDRSPYPYKGRVKKLAEALRKEGLDF